MKENIDGGKEEGSEAKNRKCNIDGKKREKMKSGRKAVRKGD